METATPTVHVRQRWSDWHACIDGDSRRWGCGVTIDDAVIDCLRSHVPDAIRADVPVTIMLTLPPSAVRAKVPA